MKIGIDCRLFSQNFTGIGRYTHELVDHIIKLNSNDEIVLFFNNPEFKDYEPPYPAVKKILVNAKHYSLAEQTEFLKILNKENCDIVHFPHFNVPIFYRKPYIITIHDLTLTFFPGRKMTKFYHRLAYNWTIKNATKRAGKIIAVSENTKSDLIEHLKVPESKITTIYHGISEKFTLIQDQAEINKTLKKYKITPPFLLYTGVWRSHKNLPRLIRAFSILLKKENLPLRLVITGRPDPHYPEVKNTVKDLGLVDDVIFPGLISEKELVHLYNAATIYTFPSLYEGFGFPPLESMKCGTPVAAANTSCIPEICGSTEGTPNAVFFDPYDIQNMADTIAHLYKSPDLQAELIEQGALHAATFSWKKMAEKTYEIIKQA